MGGWLPPEGRVIHFHAAGDSMRVGRECVLEGGGMLDTVKRNAPLGSNQSARRRVFFPTYTQQRWRQSHQSATVLAPVAHKNAARRGAWISIARQGKNTPGKKWYKTTAFEKKKEGLNAGGRRGELIYLSFLESKQSSQGTPSRSNPEMVGGPLLSG